MRDTALALVDAGMVTYSVASTMDTPDDPNLLRQVIFTVQGPSFLADDSGHSFMNFGADGQPVHPKFQAGDADDARPGCDAPAPPCDRRGNV